MSEPTTQSPPTQQPQPTPASGLDIAALILAILAPLIGLILGLVSRSRAKREDRAPSGLSFAAVLVGAILTGLTAVATIVIVIITVAAATTVVTAASATEKAATCATIAPYGDQMSAFTTLAETDYDVAAMLPYAQEAYDIAVQLSTISEPGLDETISSFYTNTEVLLADVQNGQASIAYAAQFDAATIVDWSNVNCGTDFTVYFG